MMKRETFAIADIYDDFVYALLIKGGTPLDWQGQQAPILGGRRSVRAR